MTGKATAVVISNTLIKRLEPREKPYEVRDSQLTGFIVRVQPSGVMTYVVQYGRGKRKSLGRVSILKVAQARDLAKEILADAVKGIDPHAKAKRDRAYSLDGYLETKYGPWIEAHRKTGKESVSRIRGRFSPTLGRRRLAEIDIWSIEKWRSARLKAKTKPSTVNRDIAGLKAALQKAVEWGDLEFNPLQGLKPKRVDSIGRLRYLDEGEETRLRAALDVCERRAITARTSANSWRVVRGYPVFDAAKYRLKPIVLLALNTGLRRGEIFNLTWEDISMERSMLMVKGAGAKTGKTRHIPLNEEALEVLRIWKRGQPDSGYVFPNKDGGRLGHVKRSWATVMKEAKIDDFRFHDLRHHFASRLVMAGVDLNTVRELLGHADIQMTLRYAHLSPEHMAAAVAKLVR